MAASDKISPSLDKTLQIFGISDLKPEQRKILDAILDGKDCMGVLPTGFGKSLPFQMYISMKRQMSEMTKASSDGVDDKVLVCSPLTSLMSEQVQKLSGIEGVTAAYIGQSVETDSKIKDGGVDYIYGSPESLVGNVNWRKFLKELNVTLIVVDEFHTVATWGLEENNKDAFRKWFSNVGQLRSLFPEATLLALSATCTVDIQVKVLKLLHLNDVIEVRLSPNKSNIKLCVNKVPNSVDMALSWLVDAINNLKETFPRTIIYCNSIHDTSAVYNYVVDELPHCKKFINMYHSETMQETKANIITELSNSKSVLRIIIATSALGMGIDIVNFHSAILYGAPQSVVDLVQEVGRVGRDGNLSVAILLYNSYNARAAKSHVKNFIKSTTCRRMSLLESFLKPAELEKEKDQTGCHTCCDLCSVNCGCGSCKLLPLEKLFIEEHLEPEIESDSDTISYEYDQFDLADYFDDDFSLDDIVADEVLEHVEDDVV